MAVNNISVRQRAEGECEAEAVLKITAEVSSPAECGYIAELTDGEDGVQAPCAITVLVPDRGETLWSAAKRLHLTPEELAEACRGTSFPVEG